MTRTLTASLALATLLSPLSGCGHHLSVDGSGGSADPGHYDFSLVDGGLYGDGSAIAEGRYGGGGDGTGSGGGSGGSGGGSGGGGTGDGSGSGGGTGDGSGGSTLSNVVMAGGTSSASTDDPCATLTPTIMGTDGPDTLMGTDHRDIIFAGSGDDVIWGNGGDDVICAGGGEDTVEGGIGNDYIDGGFGNDTLNGGAGNDVIHGRAGGDTIHGDADDDHVYGDILDDTLYGDDGDDVIVGGHGVDYMHGGTGDDWLRGDTNNDTLIGGGHGAHGDTISFMTATPPGQPLETYAAVSGVIVDTRDPMNGSASGDGKPEPVQGVEIVVGSAFDDHFIAGSTTTSIQGGFGNDVIESPAGTSISARPGNDTCNGAACADNVAQPSGGVVVFVFASPRDPGLVVLGTDGDDQITISLTGGVATVSSHAGTPLVAGAGCAMSGADVRCATGAVLAFITAYGGAGNDGISLMGDFPRDLEATIDGGDGNDVLFGHGGEDILFAGPTGNDMLYGTGGDDALISESHDRDVMDAGSGNDQLVTSWPCGGHEYIGGDGVDVAGFARVGNFDTAAERARQSIHAQIGAYGFQPSFCNETDGTHIHSDTEYLEGAGGDDVLSGFDGDHDETIWGREGDDIIRGYGGNDHLEGLEGNDDISGGPGRDWLIGGDGADHLHAADGEADYEINVTGVGCVADRDPIDPTGGNNCP